MKRGLLIALASGLAGVALAWWLFAPGVRKLPDPPALILQMREVVRLETLDVTLYKKISFEPDPEPADSFWGDVASWARFSLRPPRGKAIVFAVAHLGFDLSKLGPGSLRVEGDRVDLVLPPVVVEVSLKPADTEIIGSNLDSQETARLFELARNAFESEVRGDKALREKARASAERAMRSLFLSLGFREVRFLDELPAARGPS